jgi:hypothetical protein
MADIHLTQEEGLRLIEQYVSNMMGEKIEIKPPHTIVQMELFHHLSHFVREHYEKSSES